ncbi:MAG: hypothetical protein ACREDR_04300 [Blastocatellia bacterium]
MRLQRFLPSQALVAVICLTFSLAILLSGCSALSGDAKIGEGVVNANVLQIRSSTAMVSLNVAQAKKGDRLDILDQMEVKTPTRVVEWYKVRTKVTPLVTGWVEARSIVSESIIDKTEKLYEDAKPIPSQGKGRLKVQTKLRVEPAGDVATLLNRGTSVDIVGKARTTYKPEKQPSGDDSDEDVEEPETKTLVWYLVRLQDSDLIKAGWVGGQQVELDVPEDIIYLEGEGRRFTGWVVFDQTRDKNGRLRDNYIGCMKSLETEGPIDFTRLWVLVFSPDEGRYVGPYIEDGLRGVLPITMARVNGYNGFTFHELDENGKPVKVEYELSRKDSSHVVVKRITPKFYAKKKR